PALPLVHRILRPPPDPDRPHHRKRVYEISVESKSDRADSDLARAAFEMDGGGDYSNVNRYTRAY
ncbi:MAG: hypothetical protein AAB862_02225, partial [Patescibacteria group bacterium]